MMTSNQIRDVLRSREDIGKPFPVDDETWDGKTILFGGMQVDVSRIMEEEYVQVMRDAVVGFFNNSVTRLQDAVAS